MDLSKSSKAVVAFFSLVVIQIGIGLIYKFASSSSNGYQFSQASSLAISEFIKLAMTCGFYFKISAHLELNDIIFRFKSEVPHGIRNGMILLSMLYLVNNHVYFVLITLSDPGTINLIKSSSTLLSALILMVFLKRFPTQLQWFAIIFQVLGLFTSQYDESIGATTMPWTTYMLIFVNTIISAGCGCYNDYLTKASSASLHALNIWLYTFGVIFNMIFYLGKYFVNPTEPGFFVGFSGWGLMVVFCNSIIGIAITAIYKYGDAVIKCLAQATSTSVLLIFSFLLFGASFRILTAVGCAIIFLATYLYMVPLASNIKNEIAKPDCDQESGEILLPKSGLMKLPKVSLTKLAGLVSLLTVLIFSLTITTTYGSTISIFRETPRIAVLLSGRIGVGGKNGGPNMISEAMNSHTKHVFPGFESYGYAVDAFIHSNEPEYEAELLERYHPVSYKIETGKPNSGFLDSLQEAMDVLDNYISNSEARYDWVLWTRFDAYYPRAFEIPKLNNSLFYIPYWCKASGIIIYKDDERVCRQLNYFLPHDATGIPDFWFLSNYEMFRTVMKNISSDFANNKFATGGTAAWHGEMFGRLKQSGVPVGRYWYHHLDYDYIRMISNEEGDLFGRHTCWNQTLEWLYSDEFVPRNPAAERKLGEASYCPNTASYCGCGEKGKGFFPTALG